MKTVQDLVDKVPNLVQLFHNGGINPVRRSFFDVLSRWIDSEYSTWREEQRAWRETCILFDQSHHMSVTYLKGPDAKKMLSYLSPCTFANLATNRGKQYFCVNSEGKHIGDCILHYYGEEEGFELISGFPLQSWVMYHAETGGWDVSYEHDPASPMNPEGQRRKFRFEIEGPAARDILDEACEGGFPDIKFFHTDFVAIAGVKVHVLRHAMAGHGGAEIAGPYEDKEKVLNTLLEVGAKHGIKRGGTKTYFSSPLESGWIPNPFPAIYSDTEEMKKFRQWLPIKSYEGILQISGSFVPDNVEDLYVDAWDLGYDRFIKFDHEFIGREALEAAKDKPHRVKRALEFNQEDVMRVVASQFDDGPRYKAIEGPVAAYGSSTAHQDELRSVDGELIGVSQWVGISANERCMISNCYIDEKYAEPGTEVVVVWGEPNGGSNKPQVERHAQTTIRATVSGVPFAKTSKEKKTRVI
jgi:syringate O-demethylase/vanillate/3-O-methylgallate O-demethylase